MSILRTIAENIVIGSNQPVPMNIMQGIQQRRAATPAGRFANVMGGFQNLVMPTPPTPPANTSDPAAVQAYNEALLSYNQQFQQYHTRMLQMMMRQMQMMQMSMARAQQAQSASNSSGIGSGLNNASAATTMGSLL